MTVILIIFYLYMFNIIQCFRISYKTRHFHHIMRSKLSLHDLSPNFIANETRNESSLESCLFASDLEKLDDRIIQDALLHIYSSQMEHSNVFSLYMTGGGMNAISLLTNHGGASKSLLEAYIPYLKQSLDEFLDSKIEHACCEETSILMAKKGYQRVCELFLTSTQSFHQLNDVNMFAVSCAAALATTRSKLGDHKCYVSIATESVVKTYHCIFNKNIRSRYEEDMIVSRLIILAIADQCNISLIREYLLSNRLNDTVIQQSVESLSQENESAITSEIIQENDYSIRNKLDYLYKDHYDYLLFIEKNGKLKSPVAPKPGTLLDIDKTILAPHDLNSFTCLSDIKLPCHTLIYSGSFNPLHEGHIQLIIAALQTQYNWSPNCGRINNLVVFEISAVNADKPSLTENEVVRRLMQFQYLSSNPNEESLLSKYNLTNIAISISSKPLFLQKSMIYKECTFLIGAGDVNILIIMIITNCMT